MRTITVDDPKLDMNNYNLGKLPEGYVWHLYDKPSKNYTSADYTNLWLGVFQVKTETTKKWFKESTRTVEHVVYELPVMSPWPGTIEKMGNYIYREAMWMLGFGAKL